MHISTRFIYKSTITTQNEELCTKIDSAATTLFNKIKDIDVNELLITDYNRRYLDEHITNLQYSLQKFGYLILLAIEKSSVPLNELVILDYGGGSGMMSLLAKELSVGTVIYNDIYEKSCVDARIIAKTLGIEAEHYIQGDIIDLKKYLNTKKIELDAIVSYDVIEHIYRIDDFFVELIKLQNKPFNIVLGSGANNSNPLIKLLLTYFHIKVEYFGRKKIRGFKPIDIAEPYLKVRKEIISQNFPNLTDKRVSCFARATRGLTEPDIIKLLSKHIKDNASLSLLTHLTNTCDPYSGSWAEHLMSKKYLIELTKSA